MRPNFYKYQYPEIFKQKDLDIVKNILLKKSQENLNEIFHIACSSGRKKIFHLMLELDNFNPYNKVSFLFSILQQGDSSLLDFYLNQESFSISENAYFNAIEYSLRKSTNENSFLLLKHNALKNINLDYNKVFIEACKAGKRGFLSKFLKENNFSEELIYEGVSLTIKNKREATLRFLLKECNVDVHKNDNELFKETLISCLPRYLKVLFDYRYKQKHSFSILIFYLEHFKFRHDKPKVMDNLRVLQRSNNFREGLPEIIQPYVNYSGLEHLYEVVDSKIKIDNF